MRRLIVMRHAKSAWDTGAPDDHARPLDARGRRDAPRVAERLVELGWVPERVISSDSQRTRETWQRLAEFLDDEPEVTFTRRLYAGGLEAIEEELADEDAWRTLMVIGHNPGWEEAVSWLSGEDIHMTTANAALLEADVDSWLDGFEQDGLWRLVDVIRPKEL